MIDMSVLMKKIFTVKKDLRCSSEMLLLFGLDDPISDKNSKIYDLTDIEKSNGVEARRPWGLVAPYRKNLLAYCQENIEYVDDVNECDIIVYPRKFNKWSNRLCNAVWFRLEELLYRFNLNREGDLRYWRFKLHRYLSRVPGLLQQKPDALFTQLNTLSKRYNKPLWCFYIDDDDRRYSIGENVKLFRTSLYQSDKLANEQAFPCFVEDRFRGHFTYQHSIAYCGHAIHGRQPYLRLLETSELVTDFIIRDGFFALGMDKDQARKEFVQNMEDNLLVFCYRGAGNFSYRFYETLMMGRIPIVINTDCVFPFEDKMDKASMGLFIDEADLKKGKKHLVAEILRYLDVHQAHLLEIQKNNRLFWEQYYSPVGYLRHLLKTI